MHYVDLGESFPTSIYLQNLASTAENEPCKVCPLSAYISPRCHGAATRDKLLSIIEAGCGTLEGFDTLIQNVQLPFGEDVSSPRGQKTSMGMSWMAKSSVPTSDAIVSPDAIHADVAPGA